MKVRKNVVSYNECSSHNWFSCDAYVCCKKICVKILQWNQSLVQLCAIMMSLVYPLYLLVIVIRYILYMSIYYLSLSQSCCTWFSLKVMLLYPEGFVLCCRKNWKQSFAVVLQREIENGCTNKAGGMWSVPGRCNASCWLSRCCGQWSQVILLNADD